MMNEMRFDFYDKINVKKAKYVFNLLEDEFKCQFWNKLEHDQNGRGYQLKTFYKSVKGLCQEVIQNKVEGKDYALIKRKYRFSNNQNGRIYVNGFGVQSLQGNLRKFLTGDYLLDIDIKNCHPNILYQLCQEYNNSHDEKLNTFYLANYINNRDEVLNNNKFKKIDVLMCLNSDEIQENKKSKGFYTKNPFLIGFHQEKMQIFKKLLNNTDYVKKYDIQTTNEDNPISSKINKLFCIKENDIIQSVIKSDICVPMFDGFMFDKNDMDKYNGLLEQEGIIQWALKDNTIDIDITNFDENDSKDYNTIKEEFEKTACMIKSSPIIYLQKIKDENCQLKDVYYNKASMTDICEPLSIITSQGKEEPFFKHWLKDRNKRQYDKFDFMPYVRKEQDPTPPHIYNTYNEWESDIIDDIVEPKWYLDWVFIDLANRDEDKYNYYLNYIAHLCQKPWENPFIALIFKGRSGNSKDLNIECIERMMGKSNNYVHRTSNINDILPRDGFNSELKNKLFIQFNETDGRDGREAKERIKDFITRETNNIKEKYIAPYTQRNTCRVGFCSNNASPIQLSHDDRRFVIFEFNDEHVGDHEYWGKIVEKINDKAEMNNLYSWLLKRDISNWNPKDRPKSTDYIVETTHAIPKHIKWLNDVVNNEYGKECFNTTKKLMAITVEDIGSLYQSWLVENHIINMDEFKSQWSPFKKAIDKMRPAIKWNGRAKINGKSLDRIVFYINEVREILSEYKFDTDYDSDDTIADFDCDSDSDIEESIPC
jgi:hypothetical protein